MFLEGILAEREGFEPPIALRLCLISSQVHSTSSATSPRLYCFCCPHQLIASAPQPLPVYRQILIVVQDTSCPIKDALCMSLLVI